MRCLFVLLGWAFACTVQVARAEEISPLVELRWQGKQLEQSKSAQQRLREQAVLLVESSNFHSGQGDKYHLFKLAGVQNDYRMTVAGRYLVVTFPNPQKLNTVGGEVIVAEIIVGANRDDYASALFTIDPSGSVVGHAKYAGERCIELLKTLKPLMHDT